MSGALWSDQTADFRRDALNVAASFKGGIELVCYFCVSCPSSRNKRWLPGFNLQVGCHADVYQRGGVPNTASKEWFKKISSACTTCTCSFFLSRKSLTNQEQQRRKAFWSFLQSKENNRVIRSKGGSWNCDSSLQPDGHHQFLGITTHNLIIAIEEWQSYQGQKGVVKLWLLTSTLTRKPVSGILATLLY